MRDTIKLLAADTCNRLDEFEVISQRDWRRVIRRSWKQGRSVVIKLWARPDVKGIIRRTLHISSADHEWRNLRILYGLGVRVPKPIGFVNIGRNPSQHTDLLIMEDLGDCQESITYLKSCIQEGDEEGIQKLESSIIDMTVLMVRARLLDYDHSLINIVVTSSGEVVRLDLEQARKVWFLGMHTDLFARMLSTFIASYIYAVQPDTGRVYGFIEKLFAELKPPTIVLKASQKYIDAKLSMQEKNTGINIQITLPI